MWARVSRGDQEVLAPMSTSRFRRKAVGVVEAPPSKASLNRLAGCELASIVAGGPCRCAVTSPYMPAARRRSLTWCPGPGSE
jgi:hypothetical protein